MQGYCLSCKKQVEIFDIETVRISSLDFVHRGDCVKCKASVWVKVEDHEIIVDKDGHKFPDKVYVRTKKDKRGTKPTPGRLYNRDVGQDVFVDGKQRKKPKRKEPLPRLDELKRKVRR